ncbi:hypothetical protein PRN20_04500 [Devosia sp. ZB163]|uniref:hypothetical protein n=1 Tax=Devosia sp. ZB163 TaxID=3025938 RepID=UPI00235DDAC3|nr:hypothetical protein [Devosia sp. ZB163]MDC9822982.1 hypothetical protein [Devosia sp. ZB163]
MLPTTRYVFDLAGSLEKEFLAKPDSGQFASRVSAALAPWLACYAGRPSTSVEVWDENPIVGVHLLMRSTDPCPLTGKPPRSLAIEWLQTATLPPGQLPGTTTKDQPWLEREIGGCERFGDLDVAVLQITHLLLEFKSQLTPEILDRWRLMLKPYGGLPRLHPYVDPHGECFAFKVIETENHILLQEVGRILVNQLMAEIDPSDAYSNTLNEPWLRSFLLQLVRRDFYEFNSLPYSRYQLKALLALNNFAQSPVLKKSAEGVLNWLVAKHALSANLDRDHRTYRRQPTPQRYGKASWWGSGNVATVPMLSLLVGPLQHAHQDVDLESRLAGGEEGFSAIPNVKDFPDLGTMHENNLVAIIDVATTSYRVPPALVGWLEHRFTSDEANRVTYLQAFSHTSPLQDDPNLFRQANGGVELSSGNRNWSIVAGGVPVPPGDPGKLPGGISWGAHGVWSGGVAGSVAGVALAGTPAFAPVAAVVAAVGVLSEALSDNRAREAQSDILWREQPAIMRETILIPTPNGLSRSQTIRFGNTLVTPFSSPVSPKVIGNRLCVTHGFACGFDLRMPTRPFPDAPLEGCPFQTTLPPQLEVASLEVVADGRQLKDWLGCLVYGAQPDDVGGWRIWQYESGALAISDGKTTAVWVERDALGKATRVRYRFRDPGTPDDLFFMVATLNRTQLPLGAVPGGSPWKFIADPGEAEFGRGDLEIEGDHSAPVEVVLARCGFYNFHTTGRFCAGDVPPLYVDVSDWPKQPFSCAVENFRGQLLVMEVGSCPGTNSPYGFYVAVKRYDCTRGLCPPFAQSYGFVVVAPSRGWSRQEFIDLVLPSIDAQELLGGGQFRTGQLVSVAVPVSPPVSSTPDGWRPSGPASAHGVTFQWTISGDAQVLMDVLDSETAGILAQPHPAWPTAHGAVFAPDVDSTRSFPLFQSGGNGCFTVAGLPTVSESDPPGLLVDMRGTGVPFIDNTMPSSALGGRCS